MKDQLVGIRHKGQAYMTKKHPNYEGMLQELGKLSKVDEIDEFSNTWVRIVTYLPNNMLGELRVRVEDCDQFYYLVEDK